MHAWLHGGAAEGAGGDVITASHDCTTHEELLEQHQRRGRHRLCCMGWHVQRRPQLVQRDCSGEVLHSLCQAAAAGGASMVLLLHLLLVMRLQLLLLNKLLLGLYSIMPLESSIHWWCANACGTPARMETGRAAQQHKIRRGPSGGWSQWVADRAVRAWGGEFLRCGLGSLGWTDWVTAAMDGPWQRQNDICNKRFSAWSDLGH